VAAVTLVVVARPSEETAMSPVLARRIIVAIPGILLAVAACTGGAVAPATGGPSSQASPSEAGSPGETAASPGTSGAAEGTTVEVKLQEWSVLPTPDTAAAGSLTFDVTNDGPEDTHEFVVLKTDLDPGALPTEANGSVSEAGEGIEVVDEIEDIPVGETQQLTVDLDAGKYVLLCNIYDEAEQEAHYMMGMRIGFVVTD
jgi:uncharacterized cupredoxin-like copper-binding protein